MFPRRTSASTTAGADIEAIGFLREKYGCELVADARALDGWQGLGVAARIER